MKNNLFIKNNLFGNETRHTEREKCLFVLTWKNWGISLIVAFFTVLGYLDLALLFSKTLLAVNKISF